MIAHMTKPFQHRKC